MTQQVKYLSMINFRPLCLAEFELIPYVGAALAAMSAYVVAKAAPAK